MKIKLLATLVLSFLILTNSLNAQKIDSLKNELKTAPEDTHAKTYNILANSYYEISMDSVRHYSQKALDNALRFENHYEEARALMKLGSAYQNLGMRKKAFDSYQRASEVCKQHQLTKLDIRIMSSFGNYYYDGGQLDSSLHYYSSAMKLAKENNKVSSMVSLLNNMGNIYYFKGNYEQALKNYLEAYYKAGEIGDYAGQCTMLINLGNIYSQQKQFDKALENYREASDLGKKYGNNSSVATCTLNTADVYLQQDKYQEALKGFQDALRQYQKIREDDAVSICYHSIGQCFNKLGNNPKAIANLQKALEINTRIENTKSKVVNLEELATIYIQTKQFDKAKKAIKEGVAISKERDFPLNRLNFSQIQSQYFEGLGEYKLALYHHKRYITQKDSIDQQTSSEKIAELQTRYETEKKEKENELLRVKNNLVEVQLHQQKQVRNYLLGFSIVALLLIFSILSLLRNKTKTNRNIQKMNQELEHVNLELKSSNATKDKFFSIIAHDLRSPFNSILGFSDLIKNEINNGSDMTMIQECNSALNLSAQKLYNLLENLLEWANTQRGKIKYQPEEFDLFYVVQANIEIQQHRATEKEIQLVSDIEPETMIFADQNMINTVLRNLINNALKFTPHGGTVKVLVSNEDGKLEISVQDTGVGINPEDQPKLFKMDQNFSTTGTEDEEGSGLGLILCKEFVDKHNGTIRVESEPNAGSTFIVSLKQELLQQEPVE